VGFYSQPCHQGGRLMVGTAWAAAPSGRQMTLVPSWQQQQGTLLVPAPEDWRRPILTDNAQGIRFAQGRRRNYCFLKSVWRVKVTGQGFMTLF
jgi:hypothetical protein